MKILLSVLIELGLTTMAVYMTYKDDVQFLASIWHAVMRSCQVTARKIGEFGIKAELRYMEVVRA
jgi:hypothetical protein